MTPATIILSLAMLSGVVPSSPAQPYQAPQPEEGNTQAYTIGPEDILTVSVWQEPDLHTTVSVRPDGRISLPLINEVDVGGKTPSEVQQEVTTRYGAFLGAPVVSVIVTTINSRQISILGKVRTPGRYPLLSDLTIFDAIAIAGGFTDYADRDSVYVVRRGPSGVQRFKVNVPELLEDSDEMPLVLLPSDTIYVR